MGHTVTISEKSTLNSGGLLIKRLTCNCGWSDETLVWKSEAMARHHLLYTHGGGLMVFGRFSEIVYASEDEKE